MKDIIRYLASLPRRQKQLVFVAMDVCVLPLIMWLVYAIRLAKPNVPVMQGLDFWYLYVGMLGVLGFGFYSDEHSTYLLFFAVFFYFVYSCGDSLCHA